jgi:hypothetical protein
MKFDMNEANFKRMLSDDEAIVYKEFVELGKRLLEKKLTDTDAHDWVHPYFPEKTKRVFKESKLVGKLGLDIWVEFDSGYASVVAEADNNHKRRDIKFAIDHFEEFKDRFINMSKEFAGCGNGSYYVYDTLLGRLVYKEDD